MFVEDFTVGGFFPSMGGIKAMHVPEEVSFLPPNTTHNDLDSVVFWGRKDNFQIVMCRNLPHVSCTVHTKIPLSGNLRGRGDGGCLHPLDGRHQGHARPRRGVCTSYVA